MAQIQHTCSDCIPIDASILEVYTQLIGAKDSANTAAERAEHAAEYAIGKSPYIGENGDWWEWNDELGQFVDTMVQARGQVAVDTEMSATSTNPVQNRAVTAAVNAKYTKPSTGIPASDIASGVIPDVSQFITASVNNLVNYYLKSETYTRSEVDSLIGSIQGFSYEVVATLPTASASTMGKIYLAPSADPQTQNVKDEYITLQSGSSYSWEQIGSTAIDLSCYVTTAQLNTALASYTTTANLTALLAAKQDVISDLSAIRSGAAAGATAYQKPGTGIPKTDMTSAVQTSLEKADSAYQKPVTGIPASDIASGVIPTVPAISTDISSDASSDTKTASPKAVKTYVDANAGGPDVVKYTEQSLTTGQKRQARKNIGTVEYVENGVVDKNFEPAEYVTRDEIKNVVFCPPGEETDIDNEDITPYNRTGYYVNENNGSIQGGGNANNDIVVMPLPSGFAFMSFQGLDDFYPIFQLGNQYPVYFWSGSAAASSTYLGKTLVDVNPDGTTESISIPDGATQVGFYVANRATGLEYDASEDVSIAVSKTGGMEDRFGNPLVADEVSEEDERPVQSKAVARALANIATAITPEYPTLPNIEPGITWTPGYFLNQNGVATASQYCAISGYIPVPRGAFALRMNVMKGGVSTVAAWIGYTEESEASAITGEMCFDTTAGDAYTDEVLLPILSGVPFIRISRWADTYVDGDPVISFVTLADSREVTPGMVQLQGRGKNGVPEVGFLPLAKVEIDSELLTPDASDNSISPLTTSKNEVGVDGNGDIDGTVTIKLTMADGKVIEDDISIAYQGNSTLTDPKKGLSIDTANKHRIGEWLAFDSFHLKAYWTDWMHARDLVGNKLLEQIYLSRSMETRRPFMKDNNFDPSDDRLNSDTGIRCHIDGFPVELYINGVYWGLYSWNVKKDRSNYALNKNDDQHIMVECGYDGAVNPSTGDIVWTSCEFRNPKTVKNADGTKYDGDDPQEIQDGDVKKSWVRFCTFLHSITASTTKAEVAQYIDIEDFVDYTVLADALLNSDTFRNNILWTCWDATVESDVAVSGRWHPLTYDMDLTFGESKVFGSMYNKFFTHPWSVDVWSLWANAKTPEMVLLRQIFADEIAARYRELRACGILSAVNLMDLFDSWTNSVGYDAFKREHTRWPSDTERPVDSTMRCVATIASRLIALDTKYNFSK